MSKHEFLIEELLLRWDKHFERLLSILEKGQNAKDGGDNGTSINQDSPHDTQHTAG